MGQDLCEGTLPGLLDNITHWQPCLGTQYENCLSLILSLQAVEGSIGLPVAVQCVALPWQDELCLRFMKEVEKLSQEKQRNG